MFALAYELDDCAGLSARRELVTCRARKRCTFDILNRDRSVHLRGGRNRRKSGTGNFARLAARIVYPRTELRYWNVARDVFVVSFIRAACSFRRDVGMSPDNARRHLAYRTVDREMRVAILYGFDFYKRAARDISRASLEATYVALINYLTPLPNRFRLNPVFREKERIILYLM